MKHTKTPWETDETFINPKGKKITIAEVYNRSKYMPANGYEIPSESEGKANAEFIVHAVNMHSELVTALEECYSTINQLGYLSGDKLYQHNLTRIKEVLDKAERKPHGN